MKSFLRELNGLNLLDNIRQDKSESVSSLLLEYVNRPITAHSKTSILEDAIHMQIIEGCTSTDFRNQLLEKEEITLDQVEKLAETLENVSQQSTVITTNVNSFSATQKAVCQNK